jgi:6-phosphogluconolactonase
VERAADAADAAARAAARIAAAARAAADRGGFAIALSGGRTPWLMCARLADHEVPWERGALFQVDERAAPDGDADRNLTHLRESLPAAAVERLRPMPVEEADLDSAARAYEAELPERFDLVHLGLGADGHTASLVPGDAVLGEAERLVAPTATAYQGRRRLTLTYPALARARAVLWLVTGAEKRPALRALRAGDESIPAARVRAASATLIADQAALG